MDSCYKLITPPLGHISLVNSILSSHELVCVCPLTYITTAELVNGTLTANQSPWNIWEEQIAFQLSHLYFTSRIEILKPKTSKLSQSRNLRPQLLQKKRDPEEWKFERTDTTPSKEFLTQCWYSCCNCTKSITSLSNKNSESRVITITRSCISVKEYAKIYWKQHSDERPKV